LASLCQDGGGRERRRREYSRPHYDGRKRRREA